MKNDIKTRIHLKGRKNMKKNTIRMLPFLLSMSLLASACSAVPAATPESADPGTANTAAVPAMPERAAEAYGSVTRIIGNEVTIKLAEIPVTTDVVPTAEEKAAKKAAMQALSDEERLKLKAELIVYTGKEAVIIIPVGSPITSGSTASATDSEPVLLENALSDIKSGMLLKIWIKEGGDKEGMLAEYTRIMQSLQ